jgi:Ca-activated chloride channel family protein
MFRFAHNAYLYGLIALPVLFFLYLVFRWYRRKALRKFGEWEVIQPLMPDVSGVKQGWKFFLTMAALTFLILTLARPEFGSKLEEVKHKGVELIIALDVSNSMLAQDIEPNRLERAKQAIERLVDRLQNDRIGLIIFAGDAYVQVPITDDYMAVKMFLSSISTDVVPRQGTAIGAAINLAMNSFSPQTERSKVLVLITDGENHEDDAVAAASAAAEKGIVIHTLGIGQPQGVPVPLSEGPSNNFYRKDNEGNTVISKLDEKMLQQIAAAGGGKYVRATNSRLGLNILYDEINRMEKQEIESKVYSEFDERFQYAAAFAFFLLLLEFFILERKNRFFTSLNIFGKRNGK